MTEIAVEDDRFARVILACASEPGDNVTGRLVRTFGAAETVRLGLLPPVGEGNVRVDVDHWRARISPRLNVTRAREALDVTERVGAHVLIPGDEGWPAGMSVLGDHAPVALWVRGDPSHLSQPAIGVIGARAATGYGSHMAAEIASDAVGQGLVVVSGGAYGIDAAAHRATMMASGSTVAVLAGGVDRLYPAGHNQLFEQIANSGALVSEVPPDAAPTRWRLQQRGRLIAALSSAVVVVEAGARSGALLHAAQAAEFGKPVGAVPGPVTSAASAGCHRLMRDEIAGIVAGMDDLTLMMRRAGTLPPRTLDGDVAESTPLSSASAPARASARGL